MWLKYCILLISLVLSQENSTWEIIQSEILNQNCTLECHVQGSSFAEQSDLILTDDVAYTQLVNALPYNTAANQLEAPVALNTLPKLIHPA